MFFPGASGGIGAFVAWANVPVGDPRMRMIPSQNKLSNAAFNPRFFTHTSSNGSTHLRGKRRCRCPRQIPIPTFPMRDACLDRYFDRRRDGSFANVSTIPPWCKGAMGKEFQLGVCARTPATTRSIQIIPWWDASLAEGDGA